MSNTWIVAITSWTARTTQKVVPGLIYLLPWHHDVSSIRLWAYCRSQMVIPNLFREIEWSCFLWECILCIPLFLHGTSYFYIFRLTFVIVQLVPRMWQGILILWSWRFDRGQNFMRMYWFLRWFNVVYCVYCL